MMPLENGQTFLPSLTRMIDSPPGMRFVEDSEEGQQRSRIPYDALLAPFVKQLNHGKFQWILLLLKQPEVLSMLTVGPVLTQQSPFHGLNFTWMIWFCWGTLLHLFLFICFFQQSLLTSIFHMSDTYSSIKNLKYCRFCSTSTRVLKEKKK